MNSNVVDGDYVLWCVQLYVNGEFVGGADIIEEMNEKGELKPMLQ